MKKEIMVGKTKINLKIAVGWKSATTTEKIIGIVAWTIILVAIFRLIWR